VLCSLHAPATTFHPRTRAGQGASLLGHPSQVLAQADGELVITDPECCRLRVLAGLLQIQDLTMEVLRGQQIVAVDVGEAESPGHGSHIWHCSSALCVTNDEDGPCCFDYSATCLMLVSGVEQLHATFS
jgi:hypothetical protein